MNLTEAIKEIDPIIKNSLANCHIYENHPDFEDYCQLLRLNFCKWQEENPNHKIANWRGFLYQRFYWAIADHRRVSWRRQLLQIKLDTAHQPANDFIDTESIEVSQIIAQVTEDLNRRELDFLQLSLQGLTISEIAREWQVNRNVVYRVRSRLQEKFAPFFPDQAT